jgi:hypothetical protein
MGSQHIAWLLEHCVEGRWRQEGIYDRQYRWRYLLRLGDASFAEIEGLHFGPHKMLASVASRFY